MESRLFILTVIVILLFIFINNLKQNQFVPAETEKFSLFEYMADGIKKHYASGLWIKIDEFHHLDHTYSDNIKAQKGMLQMMTKLDKTNVYPFVFLSMVYCKYDKDYQKALETLNSFIDNNPSHPEIHRALGEMGYVHLIYKEDFYAAELYLTEALDKVVAEKGVREGPLEFHYPLNYLRMLRFIADVLEDEDKYDFYDVAINRFFEDSNKADKESLKVDDEHDACDVCGEHHHDHIFSLNFPWSNSFFNNINFIILFLWGSGLRISQIKFK
ncbi:MAG: tetratricopeptide repeat protein [Candidatus Muiribacteriota bacterium]